MIIEEMKSFYDDMKKADNCTITDRWLWSNEKIACKKFGQYTYVLFDSLKYLIIQHLSNPISVKLKEFYCT